MDLRKVLLLLVAPSLPRSSFWKDEHENTWAMGHLWWRTGNYLTNLRHSTCPIVKLNNWSLSTILWRKYATWSVSEFPDFILHQAPPPKKKNKLLGHLKNIRMAPLTKHPETIPLQIYWDLDFFDSLDGFLGGGKAHSETSIYPHVFANHILEAIMVPQACLWPQASELVAWTIFLGEDPSLGLQREVINDHKKLKEFVGRPWCFLSNTPLSIGFC